MWSLLMVTVLSVCVADAADLTANFQMVNNDANHFEGKFCFHLTETVQGWEVIIDFSSPVKQVSQYQGDWVETHPDSQCATHFVLVNKNYMGRVAAGAELCVSVKGSVCEGQAGGTATLKDLSDDGMRVPPVQAVAGADPTKYNYAEVLQKSILFYEAQRSGKLPADNRITWRGDSALQDHGAKGEDLTGGWYDAGDNVKFGFPMAWSAGVLCWGLLEFEDAYRKSGQLDYMCSLIRWPLQYFVKAHTGPNELYVQLGAGQADHAQWTRPESMDQNRAAFKVDAANPGSDVVMDTAAAMACGSIAFKTICSDAGFSSTLLDHAKVLYDFGKNHQGIYSKSVPDASAFYQSSNNTDENTWGALWLYKATNDAKYLEDSKVRFIHEPAWGFAWDETIAGNQILAYALTKDPAYQADIEGTFNLWSKAGGFTYTPKCLAFRLQWGALRYSANIAFIFLVAAKYGIHPEEYRQWAMCQIHYALGDTGRSFVVGFGTNPPTQPHHRGSSCPMLPLPCSWDAQQSPDPNPHVLYGALVGGPGATDDYVDSRNDYIHNEVATDYNAGFQGAVAGLLQAAIDHNLPDATKCGKC